MSASIPPISSAIDRAAPSYGGSSERIYEMVVQTVRNRSRQQGGTLLDVGCGRGELRRHLTGQVDEYIGADVVRYDEFPSDARFVQIDLDAGQVPLPDGAAEIVVAVETIEHLENPRAFLRELRRLVKPGGLVLVTTPNQLSLLSLLTLFTKGQFGAFQEASGLYPAHITALLEIDLRRIARECRLHEIAIGYSHHGRMPLTAKNWPAGVFRGRLFSDNLILSAIRAETAD